MTRESAYARAYARALFGAARAGGSVPAAAADLAALLDALCASEDLRRWFARRVPSTPARRVDELRRRVGGLVGPATLRLLADMAAWNHLHLVPAVARHFEAAMAAAEGRRTARAVFAGPPSPETVARLRDRLAAADPQITIETASDPRLLAGLTVRIEDRVLDASLAGRLARLRRGLLRPAAPAPA
jgi:F-type H+-transporting ATPase subunit delta